MVTWTQFVAIVQEAYSEKSRSSGFDEARGQLMKEAGAYWSENKAAVQNWSRDEDETWAAENVSA